MEPASLYQLNLDLTVLFVSCYAIDRNIKGDVGVCIDAERVYKDYGALVGVEQVGEATRVAMAQSIARTVQ